MKHKLTVLACVGLALLLSTGFAFAQETITIPGGTLYRCAAGQTVDVYITNTTPLMGIGLPLTISGGATITSATLGAALPPAGGWLIGQDFTLGTSGIVNAVGGCLLPGVMQHIFTLTVMTPSACTGTIEIDYLPFFPPAGAYMLIDCAATVIPPAAFVKGTFTLTNQIPYCGTNDPASVAWNGSIVDKQLVAIDPDVCDNPLAYSLADAGGLTGTIQIVDDKFSYTANCVDKGVHTVTFRATDQCGAYVDCDFQVTVTNDKPVCGSNPAENVYFQTGVVNKQLNASDPNGDPLTFSNASKGAVDPSGMYNWATVCADVGVHTVTFDVSDGCEVTQCSFQVTVYQNAPICSPIADQSVEWCGANLEVPLVATDDNCLSNLSWSAVSAPAHAVTISGVHPNAKVVFDPDCPDVTGGPFAITVTAFDGEKSCSQTFNVTVTNAAPVITCPANIPLLVSGQDVDVWATATDANACDGKTFTLVSFVKLAGPPPGGPNHAPIFTNDGHFTWNTENSNDLDEGLWEAAIRVDDNCGGYDICTFTILVKAELLVWIGDPTKPPCTMDAYVHTLNGLTVKTYVNVSDGYLLAVGGLNLLICYDQTGLTFLGANKIGNMSTWEYFTWRYSSQSNCEGGCPTGYLRIVSIADLDNGPTHHPSTFYLDGAIIELTFQATADRNMIGQCFNVGFCTLECGDNTFSSVSGDTLFVAIDGSLCVGDTSKGRVVRRVLHLCDSKICIDEPLDDRGDMNLNGLANEVGDAVLFTNYFIYGDGVFSTYCPDPPAACYKDVQILASDVNNDGVVLTVADLIYMIRIITGDAEPFPPGGNPKVSPYAGSATASYRLEDGALHVTTTSPVAVAGAAFTFRYSGMGMGQAELSSAASGLKVQSSARNGELRVVVYPDIARMASVSAGTNDIVSIPTTGEGTVELVDVQLSDASGAMLSTTAAKVGPPKEYALLQNYPNPFNAGTVIGFNLTKATDWSLTVYNIAGQVVRTFSGSSDAGTVQVAWDGNDASGNQVASGVYFYRVKADTFTATKKMTLLK
ncbi:MAG: T9SS type A sorting domain-containing protein [Candidatus Zixiibacteriota bacterium]